MLNEYLSHRFVGAKHVLCLSDCGPRTFNEFFDPNVLDIETGYSMPAGEMDLRIALAELFYDDNKPEHLRITNGGMEAISLGLHALLKSNDHVIVQSPSYPQLQEIPQVMGCDISLWEADSEWNFSIADLEAMLMPNTRLVIINFPHNPTGALPNSAWLFELIELLKRKNIWLLSDEVYRWLEFDASDRWPSAVSLYEKAISIGSLSKNLGLGGLRVGWLYSHDSSLLNLVDQEKARMSICTPKINQLIALDELHHRSTILDRHIEIIQANLRLLSNFLSTHQQFFSLVKPKSGTTAFVHILNGQARKFCDQAYDQRKILLAPSSVMNFSDTHIRFGLGRPIEKGLSELHEFMEKNEYHF